MLVVVITPPYHDSPSGSGSSGMIIVPLRPIPTLLRSIYYYIWMREDAWSKSDVVSTSISKVIDDATTTTIATTLTKEETIVGGDLLRF